MSDTQILASDLEKAVAVLSAHGYTGAAEAVVESEGYDWDKIAQIGVEITNE